METTNNHDRMVLSSIPIFIYFYADSDSNGYELDISQLRWLEPSIKLLKI